MKKYICLSIMITIALAAAIGPAMAGMSGAAGTVVEFFDSDGYTYICLEQQDHARIWVVVAEMKIHVGQEASFKPGEMMLNYTSATLNRTFERIIFSPGPAPLPSRQTPAGPGESGAILPEFKDIKVDKATGLDAVTIGEIYQKRKALHRKIVVVRGLVVQVIPGIMNKNWIHLQDGTGDAKNNSNTLVVTSQDLPKVGEIVTVKGTLFKNRDLGSGHKFVVLMEKAVVQP